MVVLWYGQRLARRSWLRWIFALLQYLIDNSGINAYAPAASHVRGLVRSASMITDGSISLLTLTLYWRLLSEADSLGNHMACFSLSESPETIDITPLPGFNLYLTSNT